MEHIDTIGTLFPKNIALRSDRDKEVGFRSGLIA
jgi:hypothetical protein